MKNRISLKRILLQCTDAIRENVLHQSSLALLLIVQIYSNLLEMNCKSIEQPQILCRFFRRASEHIPNHCISHSLDLAII